MVYTHSVAFKQFDPCAKKHPNEISSFSESDALKLIKEAGTIFKRMFESVFLHSTGTFFPVDFQKLKSF